MNRHLYALMICPDWRTF